MARTKGKRVAMICPKHGFIVGDSCATCEAAATEAPGSTLFNMGLFRDKPTLSKIMDEVGPPRR